MYREENGQVILSMSKEDWDRVSLVLDLTRRLRFNEEPLKGYDELLDRLNSGNPHYTPYQTGESK